MYIEEFTDGDVEGDARESRSSCTLNAGYGQNGVVIVGGKARALVGIGARILFYPTLLYNVVRNRVEPAFHWWDEVDKFVLLGAVPFPTDIPQLKQQGVCGVVTLNEPYETLIPPSLYNANGIQNLVIPTRDYLFAPSFGDICLAVDFIHKNASCGKTTYVHCKAGRGRSTTVVLCYLVQHKRMTPGIAYEYVRSSRPRVLLAPSQWQAVQEYYNLRVKSSGNSLSFDNHITRLPALVVTRNLVALDDNSFVVISESDLDGYDEEPKSSAGKTMWAELYRVQFAGHAALARFSRIWIRYHQNHAVIPWKKAGRKTCAFEADQFGSDRPFSPEVVAVKL